jgi:ferredoxin
MSEREDRLIDLASQLLAHGRVRTFIGFGPGYEPSRPVPWFAQDASSAAQLLLNPFCGPTLARYLLDDSCPGPVGILARGCDGLGIERLLADCRVSRDRVHVVGVTCRGAVDPDKAFRVAGEVPLSAQLEGERVRLTTASGSREFSRPSCLYDRCLSCADPSPRWADDWLDEPLPPGEREFAGVPELEQQDADQRYAFWTRQFSRCLRCHACRQACPACHCVSCSLDHPEWLDGSSSLDNSFMYHFTRAYHVAGRCIACGECQQACPAQIPLMLLNDKFMRDIRDLFGVCQPHRPQEKEPLGQFCPDDPEGWREGGMQP